MVSDYRWSIKRDLNNIEHDNQEREHFYHSFYVHEGFIFVVCLLNDLMKILVGLGIFNIFIFLKIQDLIVIAKVVFLNKQTNICLFKYELRGFYDFTLRNIAFGQYHIYRKQMRKMLFSKNVAFLYSKNGS